MRRLFFAVLVVGAATLIAGCGSSKTSGASNPTLQTLSYFPTAAPFVLTLQTDPQSNGVRDARTLEQRFPQAALLQTALFARLGQLGIDYDKDIRPLYGNPFAIGVLSTHAAASHTPFLGVWVTGDRRALAAVITKLGPGLQDNGTHDGAKLYTAGDATLAINGATVLIARSRSDIDAALDRHQSGQGISASQYAHLTTGLAGGSLVQMFGNVTQALSTPQAASARRVPWVAAITGYGASLDAASSGLSLHFHLDTTGRSLSTSQLPIATGSPAPDVAASAPIQLGLRDLIQPIEFAEATEKAADPAQYATFGRHVSTLKRRAGFDLNAFVALLTGPFAISSDTKTTIGRVGVSNPTAAKTMLAKVAAAPGLAFRKGTRVDPLGGGLYALHETSGTTLTFGVVGDQLLAGKATAAQIHTFATSSTTAVPAATGAVAFRIALRELLQITLKRAPSPVAAQLLNLLGDLTGSVSTATNGLDGAVRLALK